MVRVYLSSRGPGVSFGPVALILFVLFVMPFVLLGYLMVFVVQVTVFICREVREARSRRAGALR